MIQPTYYGSQRLGTYCILRALTPRKNQVLLPSHEQNLNPHKPIIHYSIRIHGRRKEPMHRLILTPSVPRTGPIVDKLDFAGWDKKKGQRKRFFSGLGGRGYSSGISIFRDSESHSATRRRWHSSPGASQQRRIASGPRSAATLAGSSLARTSRLYSTTYCAQGRPAFDLFKRSMDGARAICRRRIPHQRGGQRAMLTARGSAVAVLFPKHDVFIIFSFLSDCNILLSQGKQLSY